MRCIAGRGDDVTGFEGVGELSGGIQATGNYPGKARTPEELMADIDKALSLIPGIHKINLHANYAIFEEGEKVDRNKLEPNILRNGLNLQKQESLVSILTLPTSLIPMLQMLPYPVKMMISANSGLSMEKHALR